MSGYNTIVCIYIDDKGIDWTQITNIKEYKENKKIKDLRTTEKYKEQFFQIYFNNFIDFIKLILFLKGISVLIVDTR